MIDNILFHHFKHHLGHIKTWIAHKRGNLDSATIITIKTLGSSQLDMYCGQLGVNDILQEVSAHLLAEGIDDIYKLAGWVNAGFKLCTLSDGSCFTLRFINHEKFVHIHPGRHVPHTMRIKANALKSIICYMLSSPNNENINIENLNNIRQQYLQLSPVAASAEIHEMEKVYRLLNGS